MNKVSILKENQDYTAEKLMQVFKVNVIEDLIDVLMSINDLGILKLKSHDEKNSTHFMNIGIERLFKIYSLGELNTKVVFNFKYVGIMQVSGNYTLLFYPKYISDEAISFDITQEYEKFKQIIKVIQKYKNRLEYNLTNSTNDEEKNIDILGLKFRMINRYHEYGLYNKEKEITTLNGKGSIKWNQTINNSTAYIVNDIPIYLDLYVNEKIVDFNDIVSELHGTILSEISVEHELLLDILNIEKVHLTEKSSEDIGEKEFLIDVIEKEMNNQFVTWKVDLLQDILFYLNMSSSYEESEIQLFGTTSFNLIWEDVCSIVYKNHLDSTFEELQISNPKSSDNIKLKDYIEKPKWKTPKDKFIEANATLELDVLNIENNHFNIYDAKYYNIRFKDGKITGQPGVSDVTKQYLYQLLFKDVIKTNNLIPRNNFVIPKDNLKKDNQIYTVSEMDMFHEIRMGLKQINVIARDCVTIFDQYLSS